MTIWCCHPCSYSKKSIFIYSLIFIWAFRLMSLQLVLYFSHDSIRTRVLQFYFCFSYTFICLLSSIFTVLFILVHDRELFFHFSLLWIDTMKFCSLVPWFDLSGTWLLPRILSLLPLFDNSSLLSRCFYWKDFCLKVLVILFPICKIAPFQEIEIGVSEETVTSILVICLFLVTLGLYFPIIYFLFYEIMRRH